MTYAIAAAGTGGHVYPGLAVAEALVASGVGRDQVVFFGGDRMERQAVPAAEFPFVQLELRGLERRLTIRNLSLPAVVWRAASLARRELARRDVRSVLGMGGYVTVPVAFAARRQGASLLIHEQNAHAGLANRLAARWAARTFVSFPDTQGLDGEVVGNPLRPEFSDFEPGRRREEAFARYELEPDAPTLGVFGGSLGAGAINQAIGELARDWTGDLLQVVHLVGSVHADTTSVAADRPAIRRRVVGFESRMDLFYEAADVVVARAGGSLFEIAATGTPMIVVPGTFGGGHQAENAASMERAGAAIVIPESELGCMSERVQQLMGDESGRERMARDARRAARPAAAETVAAAMMEAAHV